MFLMVNARKIKILIAKTIIFIRFGCFGGVSGAEASFAKPYKYNGLGN